MLTGLVDCDRKVCDCLDWLARVDLDEKISFGFNWPSESQKGVLAIEFELFDYGR